MFKQNFNSPGRPGLLFFFKKHSSKEHKSKKSQIIDNFHQFLNILFYICRFNSVGIISEAVMCDLLLNRNKRTGQGKNKGQYKNNMVPICRDRTSRRRSKKCKTVDNGKTGILKEKFALNVTHRTTEQ